MNALLFCQNEKINLKQFIKYEKVYVVSNNWKLKKKVEKVDNFLFCLFETETFIFYKETEEIAKLINRIINTTKLCKPSYLYELCYSVEGGIGGKIADVLYSINTFQNIIQDRNIDVFYCEQYGTEDSFALECIANHLGKRICYLKQRVYNWDELKRKIYLEDRLVWRQMLDIRAQVNWLRQTVKIHKLNKWKTSLDTACEIGIINFTNTIRHVENWIEWARALGGISRCFYCCGADIAADKFVQGGEKAVSIEGNLQYRYLVADYISFLLDRYRILKKIRKEVNVLFQGVNVSKYIIKLYCRSLSREKFSNIIYERMVNDFVKENKCLFLIGMGNSNNVMNCIFSHAYRKNNISIPFASNGYTGGILLPQYEMGFDLNEPYVNIMNVRFFLKNSQELSYLRQWGWKGKAYVAARVRSMETISTELPAANSRLTILWAPSYPARGGYSISTFRKDNEYIINGTAGQEVDLYIKFHPNQNMDMVTDLLENIPDNIHVVEHTELVKKYILMADLVITSPSSIVFDAAANNRAVICMINAKFYQWTKSFRRGFIFLRREKIDLSYIIQLHKDKKTFNEIIQKCVDRQNAFRVSLSDKTKEDIPDILKKLVESEKRKMQV